MMFGKVRPSRMAQVALCMLGGLTIACADQAATRAVFGPYDGRFWAKSLVLAGLLLIVFMAGERLIALSPVRTAKSDSVASGNGCRPAVIRAMQCISHASAASWLRELFERFDRLGLIPRLLIYGAVIGICWMPVIIMMAPGTIWFDTGDQIAQFFGISAYGQPAGAISSHHPVLDTLVFGGAAWLGDTLTGNYQNGLIAYLAVQVAATILGLAAACLYVRHIGCGRAYGLMMLVFFSVFPAFPIFTMSIVKDSLHMVFLIPWLIMMAETVRTGLEALASRRFLAGLFVLSLGCALTTMTGLYITVLSLLALPVVAATRRRRLTALAAALGVTLLAVVIFPAAVAGPLKVAKEDSNQILVVPMQMTARYALDHPHDITPDERKAVDTVNHVPFDHMASRYNPYLADPIIQYSLRDANGVPDYATAWAQMGLRHPDSYLIAFASLESGWFSFLRTPQNSTAPAVSLASLDRVADQAIGNQMDLQIFNAYSKPFRQMPAYAENRAGQSAAHAWWNAWRSLPIIRILTFTSVWTFVLPLFLVYCRLGRAAASAASGMRDGRAVRRHSWFPFAVPLVWSLLSLLPNAISIPLKPTATRYMLWSLIMVPLLIGLLRADAVRPERLWRQKGV
ncbi:MULTISPECIES: DUF6020 family protein [unclassified Bifidobacterium]|uniref:DUF6020 family protein n=2 Tax=Bifidobacterium TaxID=1678 RepID=UPI0011262BD6|nr:MULTISPECIES: DUF6020 family protein [unclassified Bifidobacterium]